MSAHNTTTYRAPKLMKTASTTGLQWSETMADEITPAATALGERILAEDTLVLDDIQELNDQFDQIDKNSPGFQLTSQDYPDSNRIAYQCLGGRDGQAWVRKVLANLPTTTTDTELAAVPDTAENADPTEVEEEFDTEAPLDEDGNPYVEWEIPDEEMFMDLRPHLFVRGIDPTLCNICGRERMIMLHLVAAPGDEQPATGAVIAAAEEAPADPIYYCRVSYRSDSIRALYVTRDRGESWEKYRKDTWRSVPAIPGNSIPLDTGTADTILESGLPYSLDNSNKLEWAIADYEMAYSTESVEEVDVDFFSVVDKVTRITLGAKYKEMSFEWSRKELEWDLVNEYKGSPINEQMALRTAAHISRMSRGNRVVEDAFNSIRTLASGADKYTPKERSENASQQVRDKKGRFAKANSTVKVGNTTGTVSKIHPETQEVTIKTRGGKTVRVAAKHIEVVKSAPPSTGKPLYQMVRDIPGQPRGTSFTPKAMLPKLLPVMTPDELNSAVTGYEKFISDTRRKKLKSFELTPEKSDVKPLYLAVVDEADKEAVIELLALVPSSANSSVSTTYVRTAKGWERGDTIHRQLKSTNPPPVVALDEETYESVKQQVDIHFTNESKEKKKKKKEERKKEAVVDNLWDEFGLIIPVTAAGGADRNRGNAEVLRRYWKYGPGAAKIMWPAPGAWRRCVANLSKHLGQRSRGYCSLRFKEMRGYWPGDKRNRHKGKKFALTPGMVLALEDSDLALIVRKTTGEPRNPVPKTAKTGQIFQADMTTFEVITAPIPHATNHACSIHDGTLFIRADVPEEEIRTELLTFESALLAMSTPFTDELNLSRSFNYDTDLDIGNEFLVDDHGTLMHVEVLDPAAVRGWEGEDVMLFTNEDGMISLEREGTFHV